MARCGEETVQGKNEVSPPPPRNHIFRWELEILTMSKNTRKKTHIIFIQTIFSIRNLSCNIPFSFCLDTCLFWPQIKKNVQKSKQSMSCNQRRKYLLPAKYPETGPRNPRRHQSEMQLSLESKPGTLSPERDQVSEGL